MEEVADMAESCRRKDEFGDPVFLVLHELYGMDVIADMAETS